jgi:leucyl/phenylalanyl-tRNA--protein transferase
MAGLTPEILLRAYAVGLFPMAERRDDPTLYWVDPEKRGILPLERFHVPSRLRRIVRQNAFEVRCDTAFAAVIRECAAPGPNRTESWINAGIVDLYTTLFEMGRAHSVECWHAGRLVGGLYGVALGAAFFGESMFSRKSNASKVALVHLVARLRRGGFRLLDTQFVTPHLARLGAVEIGRAAYHQRLQVAVGRPADFLALPPCASLQSLLQLSTQTS